MKKRFDNSDDARLHVLLQVKRFERPDARSWQRFEQGLERKQLAAIVGTKRQVGHNWWRVVFGRRVAYVLGAVSLCLLGATSARYFTGTDSGRYYDKIVEVSNGSPTEYVCDTLVPDCSFFSDRGMSMSFNDRGVGYVRDALPTGAAAVNMATPVASVY